jgi:hypothetical protein
MATNGVRNYPGKDEELSVMAGYVEYSFVRDQADFRNFSPKFSNEYLLAYREKTQAVRDLIFSATETAKLKEATSLLYGILDSTNSKLDLIAAYLGMAGKAIPLGVKAFGITAFREKQKSRDAEGAIKALRVINGNIAQYKTLIQEQGLGDELILGLKEAESSLYDANQEQYQIVSRRKELVQNNIGLLNDLYNNMLEVCKVGKALYKSSNPQKLQEYTSSELLKRVRLQLKGNTASTTTNKNTQLPG